MLFLVGVDTDLKKPRGSEHILALLTAGADVNAKDEDGFTPLHFASMSNNEPDHIQILLGNGANIMAQNKWGFTPLHWAAIASTAKQIDALLLAGADIDAKDEFGKTPLHWAVTYRNNKFT
jgi:ankyrin repeat protein